MKKLLSILTLTILCNILPAEDYNTYNPVPVKLKQRPLIYVQARIAKLLDGKDDSFAFVFVNHRQKNPCHIEHNSFYFSPGAWPETLIKKEFNVPVMNKIIFTSNILSWIGLEARKKQPIVSLVWRYSYLLNNKRLFKRERCYLWFPDMPFISFDFKEGFKSKVKFKFKIFKLVDGRDASFALVAINDSKQEIKIPGILSPASKIKIKFPDGKIFTYFDKRKGQEALRLKPGESKYIKFDIYKLLDKTNEFSPDSFNYGMSELIWEVTMPDKSIVTNSFYLLKTEKPLPEIAKTKGYLMDVK